MASFSIYPTGSGEAEGKEIICLPISQIRTDGETQCRTTLDLKTVRRYQEYMQAGVEFPPVKVWFDGRDYWLADGFQRTAAAQRLGKSEILAEVRKGTVEDAQWESYGSNYSHGLPRTRVDAQRAMLRSLAHPNSITLSNVQLARHLGIPEATLRRWRLSLCPLTDGSKGQLRAVTRKGRTYQMQTASIGRSRDRPSQGLRRKSLAEIEEGFIEMKLSASAEMRGLLNVLVNWAFGSVSAEDCLAALEGIRRRWHRADN